MVARPSLVFHYSATPDGGTGSAASDVSAVYEPHVVFTVSGFVSFQVLLCCTAFLSSERFKQLQGKSRQAEAAIAAVSALAEVEDHPSRTLIERLIADAAAWQSVHDEWQKLTANKANLEDLTAMLAKDGADKVRDELRTVYGLTPGAASVTVKLIPEARTSVCLPCTCVEWVVSNVGMMLMQFCLVPSSP